ncbi:hypothetical protein PGT21_027579 [Puccinia graminis f. sp. tritici]|uniref:CCHC-type domain-containing protein n=2 Tax=Puccinia graminis f. sp. tritici TaxID=56615 RepID=E3K262_PUCGT|nr:uncharacterized protein PGTG_04387 [Puccinia graminis f. sp. tritici CRL 75-36-700-3]EFP78431.2 hypothetical protein PGTG_04387 [Puccinia graminis f. sp. tritici CRL 75-36-700-3]KAA1119503.1 hypothetical protein PGT21_027579 [Puccinia graminis f. sp. tritici]
MPVDLAGHDQERILLADKVVQPCRPGGFPPGMGLGPARQSTPINLAADWHALINPCDQLICLLDDLWKTIRDHLAYSPNKISLDEAVGALESHEILKNIPLDHSDQLQSASTTVKGKGRPQCYTCGEKGHHLAECPKKKKFKSSLKSGEAQAGATSVPHLGNYDLNEDKDDSFDKEIDVWG